MTTAAIPFLSKHPKLLAQHNYFFGELTWMDTIR